METIVTLPPGGTLTGRLPVLLLGLRATCWPDTATWVVMGLNTPAGFCVTIVLVAPLDPVGETVGLAVVTRGPLGLKLTAAMGTRGPPGRAPALVTLVWAGWVVAIRWTEPGEARRMFGALSVTGVTPLSMGVLGRLGEGWARMGRVERLAAGTTVTLLEGIIVMVAPGLTLLTEPPPPLPTGLLVVTRVGLWLVGTDGILKIFHNQSQSLPLSLPLSLSLDLSSFLT